MQLGTTRVCVRTMLPQRLNPFCSELTRPPHEVHGMISAQGSSVRTFTLSNHIKNQSQSTTCTVESSQISAPVHTTSPWAIELSFGRPLFSKRVCSLTTVHSSIICHGKNICPVLDLMKGQAIFMNMAGAHLPSSLGEGYFVLMRCALDTRRLVNAKCSRRGFQWCHMMYGGSHAMDAVLTITNVSVATSCSLMATAAHFRQRHHTVSPHAIRVRLFERLPS